MGDDEPALVRLWREKRGEIEPEDLSGNLIVQLGTVTEQLNRHWYERNTGQVVTEVQQRVFHPVKRWMAATLDGIVEGSGAVFEAKFMLPWSFSEEAAAEKHMPQLQHNMWVTASRTAVLSIITGGGQWVEMTIPADPLYQHLLLTAEKKFWHCVESGETPHLFGVEPPRPRIAVVRIIDMSSSNSWAEFAGVFCRWARDVAMSNPEHYLMDEHICAALMADFDSEYYLGQNPDVCESGLDPLVHFHLFGWKEARNPSAHFDVEYYLKTNTDVAAADINPLLHYAWAGKSEGRQPRRILDLQRQPIDSAKPPHVRALDWAGAANHTQPSLKCAIAAEDNLGKWLFALGASCAITNAGRYSVIEEFKFSLSLDGEWLAWSQQIDTLATTYVPLSRKWNASYIT